jgi:hypothetical protein
LIEIAFIKKVGSAPSFFLAIRHLRKDKFPFCAYVITWEVKHVFFTPVMDLDSPDIPDASSGMDCGT